MKFGFINIGAKQGVNAFSDKLSAKGYNLYFVYNYRNGDDIDNILPLLKTCDVIFVSAEKTKFAEVFNLTDIDFSVDHYEIDTLLYVFLDTLASIQNIEGIIKDYYSKLNIRISPYRIFLEQGKTQDFNAENDLQKIGVTDKYMLTSSQNGPFLDIIIRYRNDSRIANLNKHILDSYFNHIYATNFLALNELCAAILIKNNVKIKLAESFTSGRIAAELAAVSGASNYLVESLVVYSDIAKQERLSVSSAVLREFGAASRETAYEMAKSVIKSGCDMAIATTGDAGPIAQRGGRVGKCFIAVAVQGKIEVNEYNFFGNREEITQNGVAHAQFLLYRKLMMTYN